MPQICSGAGRPRNPERVVVGAFPDRCPAPAALVTKDEDFADMLMLSDTAPAPVVVWIRVGNTRRQVLLEWFEALIDRIVELGASTEHLAEAEREAKRLRAELERLERQA